MASTTACAPNSLLSSVISSGRRTAAVLTETLSAPDIRMRRASATERMPPPTASGMNTLRAVRATTSGHDFAGVARCGDVEKDQLVGALAIVAIGQFDRIAGIAQVDEVDALDHAAAGDVETGNDAFGEHSLQLHEIPHDPQSDRPGFLGMKLHAEDVARFEHRGVGQRSKCRPRLSLSASGT